MRKINSSLVILFFFLLVSDFYLIFVYAPVERTQGIVQKIFYFHVSSAFAMYLGFILAGIFALLYLVKRKEIHHNLSLAGVSVGLLFCTMVLTSGPVWAKPIWGAWWTWDPRLTTTFLLWLIFFSVLLLKKFYGQDPKGAVFGSILTLFGVLDIPLILLSVKLWRSIHPSVLGEKSNMPSEMKVALIFSNITILVLFILIYSLRSRVNSLEDKLSKPEYSGIKQKE